MDQCLLAAFQSDAATDALIQWLTFQAIDGESVWLAHNRHDVVLRLLSVVRAQWSPPTAYEQQFPALGGGKPKSARQDSTQQPPPPHKAKRITPTAVVAAASGASGRNTAFQAALQASEWEQAADRGKQQSVVRAEMSEARQTSVRVWHNAEQQSKQRVQATSAKQAKRVDADDCKRLKTAARKTARRCARRLALVVGVLLRERAVHDILAQLQTVVLFLRSGNNGNDDDNDDNDDNDDDNNDNTNNNDNNNDDDVQFSSVLMDSKCARLFACLVLQGCKGLLLSLDVASRRALADCEPLRLQLPQLCLTLSESLVQTSARLAALTPSVATVSKHRPGALATAAHYNVDDDGNRNEFKQRTHQAMYNNREKQRDAICRLQNSWAARFAPERLTGDIAAERDAAVDDLRGGVCDIVDELDPHNVVWLCELLCNQLRVAALVDPDDESDPSLKAMADAGKLRKLRGRFGALPNATSTRSKSNLTTNKKQQQQQQQQHNANHKHFNHHSRHANRRPRANSHGAQHRKVRALLAPLFVGDVEPAGVAFVYYFADFALQYGPLVHPMLLAHFTVTLRDFLRQSGADGEPAAVSHDFGALRDQLSRQVRWSSALARFVGFVQAAQFFYTHAQASGSDGELNRSATLAARSIDATRWLIEPAQCIAAAQRNAVLVLVLPWVCALTLAWQKERVMRASRLARDCVAALCAVAASGAFRSRRQTAARLYCASVLGATLAALGEPMLRAPPPSTDPKRALFAASPIKATERAFIDSPNKMAESGAAMASAALDDTEELLSDEFVRLCFMAQREFARTVAALTDGSAWLNGASRPTKKITLSTSGGGGGTVAANAASHTAAAGNSDVEQQQQQQLRRWFAWQHPQLAALAETVASAVTRDALAFASAAAAERAGVSFVRANVLASLALGDAQARLMLTRLVKEPLRNVLPSTSNDVRGRTAAWLDANVARAVRERVRQALPILLQSCTAVVREACIAHATHAALQSVLQVAERRATHAALDALERQVMSMARATTAAINADDADDADAPCDEPVRLPLALRALHATILLHRVTHAECAATLAATERANITLPARVRRAVLLTGGSRRLNSAQLEQCALHAVQLLAQSVAQYNEHWQWRPLLPRAALALAELVAHSSSAAVLDSARKVAQQTAQCDSRLLVSFVSVLLAAHHYEGAERLAVTLQWLCDTLEHENGAPAQRELLRVCAHTDSVVKRHWNAVLNKSLKDSPIKSAIAKKIEK